MWCHSKRLTRAPKIPQYFENQAHFCHLGIISDGQIEKMSYKIGTFGGILLGFFQFLAGESSLKAKVPQMIKFPFAIFIFPDWHFSLVYTTGNIDISTVNKQHGAH